MSNLEDYPELSKWLDDNAETVGDEPFLLAQQTHCPVAVGVNRVAAAQLLVDHRPCDIILSDDGLQHYRMKRDFEIAVIDSVRKFGNGFCLPAGPLREPVRRLTTTDMIVYHGESSEDYQFSLEFSDAINLITKESRTVGSFNTETVHAIAGIGTQDLRLSLDNYGSVVDQDYYNHLVSEIKNHSLESIITYHGLTNDPLGVLKQYDIMLMCSRNEAYGRVTEEAIQMGIPVIGKNTGTTGKK